MASSLTEFYLGCNGGDLLLHAVRDHGAGGGRGAVDQHHQRRLVVCYQGGFPFCHRKNRREYYGTLYRLFSAKDEALARPKQRFQPAWGHYYIRVFARPSRLNGSDDHANHPFCYKPPGIRSVLWIRHPSTVTDALDSFDLYGPYQ